MGWKTFSCQSPRTRMRSSRERYRRSHPPTWISEPNRRTSPWATRTCRISPCQTSESFRHSSLRRRTNSKPRNRLAVSTRAALEPISKTKPASFRTSPSSGPSDPTLPTSLASRTSPSPAAPRRLTTCLKTRATTRSSSWRPRMASSARRTTECSDG